MSWKSEFKAVTSKTHTQQGIWWLNGFWKAGASQYAEDIWKNVHLSIEIEAGKPKIYGSKVWEVKEGADLDEFQAHVFLEKSGETLTVVALRKRLKELDLDSNNRMALSEFWLDKYKKKPEELVNSPQGGQADQEKLAAAQASVQEAAALLTKAVADADASAAAAKEAEKSLWASQAAQAELEAAVKELEAQEKSYSDKIAGYEGKINDPNLSSMKKSQASNELAQLKAEDPLPLRKAKITQGAALKKAEKAAKLAAEEKQKADEAATRAAQGKEAAERAFKAAEDCLEEIKRKGDGVCHGAVWWMERELAERKKYMPRK